MLPQRGMAGAIPPTVYTVNFEGQAVTEFSTPANTSLTTVYTVSKGQFTLKSIRITSSTTGADASVVINDGSTDHYIYNATAIAANDVLMEDDIGYILREGYIVKVKTSLANELTFTISGALVPKTF